MSRMKYNAPILVASLALFSLTTLTRGASPSLGGISPRGGQRGTEADVVFSGDRLSDAQEVLLYQDPARDGGGLSVTKLEVVANNQVKVKLKIAPDARLGEYSMRLRTLTGISDLRTFYVGALPV